MIDTAKCLVFIRSYLLLVGFSLRGDHMILQNQMKKKRSAKELKSQ
jgi:hypothetical protein